MPDLAPVEFLDRGGGSLLLFLDALAALSDQRVEFLAVAVLALAMVTWIAQTRWRLGSPALAYRLIKARKSRAFRW